MLSQIYPDAYEGFFDIVSSISEDGLRPESGNTARLLKRQLVLSSRQQTLGSIGSRILADLSG
jgi:hypothetical protein